jgi:hypothetical protein
MKFIIPMKGNHPSHLLGKDTIAFPYFWPIKLSLTQHLYIISIPFGYFF